MFASIRSRLAGTPAALRGRLRRRHRGVFARWAHLPRRTVRLRLTALYGCLFLLSGAGVLAITNLVVAHQTATANFFISRASPNEQIHIQGVVGGFSAPVGIPPLGAVPLQNRKVPAGEAGRGEATSVPGASTLVRSGSLRSANPSAGARGGSARGGPAPAGSVPPGGSAVTVKSNTTVVTPQQLIAPARALTTLAHKQRTTELNGLLVVSGIALAIMAVVSIVLGWLISGRVLRPLRTMTTTTRRISEDNLHERLALQGPDDELKDLADTIDGLLARLEAAFEAQRRFVANASHELRTPLAMMRTSLDVAVAKPEPVSPQVSALEHKLREGLDQADRLLESFLVLARAQHGALADHSTVSLARILSAAIQERARAIAAKDIEVRAVIREADVVGSDTLLTRMVENVIDNAIAHNERGGWIRVETEVLDRPDGDHAPIVDRDAALAGATVRVIVESGGPHLDESVVRELAQPFRRAGADRTGSHKGVGLGLSIVAAIAAAHGGVLELHARAEGGLRVTIELPCAGAARVVSPHSERAPLAAGAQT
jgi:signal transduction histidine kinase